MNVYRFRLASPSFNSLFIDFGWLTRVSIVLFVTLWIEYILMNMCAAYQIGFRTEINEAYLYRYRHMFSIPVVFFLFPFAFQWKWKPPIHINLYGKKKLSFYRNVAQNMSIFASSNLKLWTHIVSINKHIIIFISIRSHFSLNWWK